MKKILTSALVIVFILIFCIILYANKESNKINPQIAEIIKSQLTSEDKEKLSDLDDTLKKESDGTFSDEVILKIHPYFAWEFAAEQTIKMIEKTEEFTDTFNSTDFFVLTEKPYMVRWSDGKVSKIKTADIPTYIIDIMSMSDTVDINGKQFPVTGLYCFDEYNPYQKSIVVCIMTQEEALFKYYYDYQSEAVVFSESDFRTYATDYNAYMTSYEHNYNESGEPLVGNFVSFIDYVNGKYRP